MRMMRIESLLSEHFWEDGKVGRRDRATGSLEKTFGDRGKQGLGDPQGEVKSGDPRQWLWSGRSL